jgi:hypothetical protein
MRKIIIIVLMSCSCVFGQNSNDSIVGKWYLASGCIGKKVGAWATYPEGATKFCFSKTKSSLIVNPNKSLYTNYPEYIENVIWTFSSDTKSNILICEYIKDRVTFLSKVNDNILDLKTKTDVSYKNKYYWSYEAEKEIMKIYKDKKLSKLLAEFKIEKKTPLTLLKN